jgi:glycosyltransferase 2 family protein
MKSPFMQHRREPHTLPLSWARTRALRAEYREVPIPFSPARWVCWAEIPESFSAAILNEDLSASFPEGFVFRGCPRETAECFASKNCSTIRTGYEAVLDLQEPLHGGKKMRSTLARGARHGSVIEVPVNGPNRSLLETLKRESRHSDKPALRNLFRDEPDRTCRCFVFREPSGRWLAAMTLSKRGDKEMHTELMLRHRHAPGDIMECLVAGIRCILSGEGVKEWSLGEVPFLVMPDERRELHGSLEAFMFALMSRFRHAYDFEGLYRFKNKFGPSWRPVMLCSSIGLSPMLLAGMALAMGYTELLIHESIGLLKGASKKCREQVESKADGAQKTECTPST